MVVPSWDTAENVTPSYIGQELYSAEVAFCHARLLGKVESEWLQVAIAWKQKQAAPAGVLRPTGSPALGVQPPASSRHGARPPPLGMLEAAHASPHGVDPHAAGMAYPPPQHVPAGYGAGHAVQTPPSHYSVPHPGYATVLDFEGVYRSEARFAGQDDRACVTASKCSLDSDMAIAGEVLHPSADRHDTGHLLYGTFPYGDDSPTLTAPSPAPISVGPSTPSPHGEEEGLAPYSCHYPPAVPLTDPQRTYIRYLVVSNPQDHGLYTVGIRFVCDTAGARQLLGDLEKNMTAEYKRGAQGRLCATVLQNAPCTLTTNCPHIHVMPEGWRNKRRWTKKKGVTSPQ